ncbi:hypothetical protein CTEN210_13022 [Chaetoceros tenuissimus]|uniref:Uncharacterized protein n=1 Tax=Chaetoceros tenuissimus TaxID=426638 RepID=A0AAD3D2C4_9STRA|nr:hypothetical protein CTEN210_13022 [Chaetoceros tenuissimus]
MHLSECIDLFSESNTVDQEVRECIVHWLWRDKTNFHNDESLKLDPLFGALCLSFSFGGVVMLMLRPKWQEKSNFPYTLFACWLIFAQGPLSFWADYMSMTLQSPAHVIDKFSASIMFVLYFWRIIDLYKHCRPSNFILQLAAASFAGFCFINAQDAQEAYDRDSWIFYHNLWHCFPLNLTAIQIYHTFILGDYGKEQVKRTNSWSTFDTVKSFIGISNEPIQKTKCT